MAKKKGNTPRSSKKGARSSAKSSKGMITRKGPAAGKIRRTPAAKAGGLKGKAKGSVAKKTGRSGAAKAETLLHSPVASEAGRQSNRIESVIKVIVFLGILGSILSIYLLWLHYKPGHSSFCTINEQFDCAAVAKSSYSQLLGVPVAMIGMFGYLAFVVIGCFLIYRDLARYPALNVRLLNRILLGLAIVGFLFSAYLSFVQEAVLGVWCIMCIASAITMTAILVLAIISQSYCLQCRRTLMNMGVTPAKVCRYC